MNVRMRNAKILVVDTDLVNVERLQSVLGDAGFANVRGLTDARKAILLLSVFLPDIVILDVQPILDGISFLRLARDRAERCDFLPLLVVSADDSQETKRRVLGDGANDFVALPFDQAELVLRVINLLEIRFLHRDVQEELAREVCAPATGTAHFDALHRLAEVVELRDDGTGGHPKRVGDMSTRVASALGLPESEAAMIGAASQLHDIGKIGIPDAILLKPGKLTEAEFEAVKAHPSLGGDILGDNGDTLFKLARDIALSHHEWWTGLGYPRGLSGEDIPIAGRIVAVVDVFDALTHARPYKAAWSVSDAVREIERLSGTQFDPEVVGALLTVLDQSERLLRAV